MASPRYQLIYRADDAATEIAVERARQHIAQSIKVLQDSEPADTFLGRQRHDFILAPEHP